MDSHGHRRGAARRHPGRPQRRITQKTKPFRRGPVCWNVPRGVIDRVIALWVSVESSKHREAECSVIAG